MTVVSTVVTATFIIATGDAAAVAVSSNKAVAVATTATAIFGSNRTRCRAAMG